MHNLYGQSLAITPNKSRKEFKIRRSLCLKVFFEGLSALKNITKNLLTATAIFHFIYCLHFNLTVIKYSYILNVKGKRL